MTPRFIGRLCFSASSSVQLTQSPLFLFKIRLNPLRTRNFKTVWQTQPTPSASSNTAHDPVVKNAIHSQNSSSTLSDSSHSKEEVDHRVHDPRARQWGWALTEELLPNTPEARQDDILREVGRMGTWDESVAERVKVAKRKLDELEEEGGVLMNDAWAWAVAGEILSDASEAKGGRDLE